MIVTTSLASKMTRRDLEKLNAQLMQQAIEEKEQRGLTGKLSDINRQHTIVATRLSKLDREVNMFSNY
tara:strand:+ start:377 stop:580 length:204 start_codon:yes stop_codon:yes gene_type:complete